MWFADPFLISCDADAAAGEIPASVGQLTNLNALYLAQNKLSGKNCLILRVPLSDSFSSPRLTSRKLNVVFLVT